MLGRSLFFVKGRSLVYRIKGRSRVYGLKGRSLFGVGNRRSLVCGMRGRSLVERDEGVIAVWVGKV